MSSSREISRGAWANAVGLLAKGALPLAYLVLTRAYGAELFGEYLLAFFIANVVSSSLGGGFMDAVTVFAAPAAERGDTRALLAVAATSLRWGLAGALVSVLLTALLARPIGAWLYPNDPELPLALLLASLGVLPEMITRVAVGLGKAHLEMRWDPLLLGLVGPTALALLALVAHTLGAGLSGLFLALLLSQFLLGVVSLVVMRRWLALGALSRALVMADMRVPRLASFGFVQASNLAVTRYAARLDVLMLGAFGLPAWQLGWYATAAMVSGELRQLRVIYATIATPLIARAKVRAERQHLSELLHTLSRRASLLALPTLIILFTLMGDVLGVFDPHYGRGDFILALFIASALSCTFGFAGNFLIASGHQRVNLLNAGVAALVNTGLNVWLIPSLGLLGAALGTAGSRLVLVALENAWLWRLERVRLSAAHGLAAAAGLVAIFGALWMTPMPTQALGRLLLVTLVLGAALAAHATYPRLRLSGGRS